MATARDYWTVARNIRGKATVYRTTIGAEPVSVTEPVATYNRDRDAILHCARERTRARMAQAER